MNLYCLKYNSYFNRIIKKFDTLAEYLVSPYYNNLHQANISFNPNDGVDAEAIVNFVPVGDYVVFGYNLTPESDEIIHSRWFITDAPRIRGNQYRLVLKRDVIVDNYNAVIEAPCFIEKATLTADNPLIFNKEGNIYNQIKKSETLLKDPSQIPWLVLYVAKNSSVSSTPIKTNTDVGIYQGASLATWKFYNYTIGSTFLAYANLKKCVRFTCNNGPANKHVAWGVNSDGTSGQAPLDNRISNLYTTAKESPSYAALTSVFNTLATPTFQTALNGAAASKVVMQSEVDTEELESLFGKIIRFDDGTYYEVALVKTAISSKSTDVVSSDSLYGYMRQITDGSALFDSTVPNNLAYRIIYQNGYSYTINLIERQDLQVTVSVPASRRTTTNAMYDILAVPCGNIAVTDGNTLNFTTDELISRATASALGTAFGKDSLYDIQLLPYCPIQEIIQGGIIDVSKLTASTDYAIVKDASNNKYSIILFCQESSITFNINEPININRPILSSTIKTISESPTTSFSGRAGVASGSEFYGDVVRYIYPNPNTGGEDISVHIDSITEDILITGTHYDTPVIDNVNHKVTIRIYNSTLNAPIRVDADINKTTTYTLREYVNDLVTDMKISNECDMYRLVSPNYAGGFDFSVVKNGDIDLFNVDITYKPYNPYIHVNPNFNNLYGSDFNDSRGLICGGDFTYGVISDAFKDYERTNKNYREIFNRELQSMDTNYSINKNEAVTASIISGLKSTVAGAAAGGIAGGMPGAVAGGVLGAGASVYGGVADFMNMEKRYAESRDLKVDMFNYQLGNIQALPYSMSKTSSYTANYKYFPFIEYYTCTETEKEALKNKLKYNGMTVMAIGKISDYIIDGESRYIKGQMIRLEDLGEDAHMVNTIYEEIFKGIYI